MNSTVKLLLLTYIVSLLILQTNTSTCHILCNCLNSQCNSCYNTFQKNTTISSSTAGTCPCPLGFYSLNNTCLFCSNNCKVCSDGTTCIQCYTGYTKINGICSNQKYSGGVTWVQYQSYQDFKYKPNGNPSLFGFNLFPDNINSTLNFINCSTIWNNLIVGILGIGNQGVSLVRNYYGLPYHQWLHLTIKYVVLDRWNGSMINVEIYMDQKIANKTYQNSLRNTNICGGNLPDSIDQIHSFFSHQKNSISINISIPANVSLAIVQIKVDVGTCPRNCLNCLGPNSCLVCKNYYANVNGICQCNTSLSHVVSFGCLEKCLNSYVFIQALQRCVLCSIYMSNCQTCNNSTVCLKCRPNTFLSNGQCVLQCSQGNYPKKLADNDSNTAHCHPCSQNCTSCFNQSLCLTCYSSFYLSAGYCFSNCPNSTLAKFGNNCYNPNNCAIGCKTCTSLSLCQECQLGFWLFSSSCVASCPIKTFHSQNRTCQPCSSNCIKCIDSQTCQSCISPYSLINGICRYYSTSCNPGFYFDQRVSTCISCPSGCQTCHRSLCYTCFNNFYLDNGRCLSSCSSQKYQVMNNITTDNICYWKNQLCESVNSNSINSCSKCRSFDYILALDQNSSTCQTYCPLNLTYSNRSFILNQNQRICNQSCGNNCQACLSSSKCLKCAAGFVISGSNAGNCVSVCQTGYVSDSLQCLPCQYRCNTCDINGNCLNWAQVPSNNSCPSNCNNCINNICTKCNAGYFLNSTGQCLSFCSNGNFPDTVSMQCRKCSPLCSSCSSYSTCTSCFSQYYFYSQNCLNNCPSGTYPNKQQQVCSPCSINCRTCFGPSQHQCLSCYLGNYKDHSQCVPACYVHKYVDNYGYCDWCHQSCLYCFGPAEFQCLQCDNNNFLYRGQCFTNSCPSATFLAILTTKQCKDCSWGCAICTSATVCQQCFGGFYLFNNSCLSSCPTGTYYSWSNYSCTACSSNCISCASQTSCYQCQPNYSIYNGGCMFGCPNTTFPINYYSGLQCHPCPMDCINCTGIFQCTTCSTGFILKNGQCTKNCQIGKYYDIVNGSCKYCSNNCLACTAWGCMICRDGYYQYNNGCVQNCSTGNYIIPETMSCSPCLFSCLTCISLYQCQQCKAGYTLFNKVCVNGQNCSQNCQRCADLNNCIICSSGYYKVSNSSGVFCISTCPAGNYLFGGIDCIPCQTQCLSCNSSTGCTNCQTGLILFNGQCITDCYPGFYSLIVNGTKICQPCDPKCQTCTLSPTICIICASPAQVFKNGECVQNKQCLLSSFYSEAVGYCLPCISNCKICHTTTQCEQCLQNYYLTLQNQCQSSCPNGTYQSILLNNPIQCLPCQFPCQTCISSTQCQNCYPGYPLNTTSLSCQSSCNSQVGYFINSLSNTCDKCDPQCLSCIYTSNACTSCPAGYYLIDNKCVLNCPQGTFPAATVRSCLPCSQFCQSCISQTICQICQQYMVMFLDQCLPECPSGYYNQNGICRPCVNPCLQCIGGSTYQCSNCKVGYYFFNGRCTESCPVGFYKNNQTLSCQACPTSCKNCLDFSYCQICTNGYTLNTTTRQCQNTPICPPNLFNCQNCINNSTTNTTQCNKCFLGYYLISGICVEQCNSTYYGNIVTGKCESCDNNCLNCEASGSCNKCLTNFYLFNGMCYTQCPIGTYPSNETINNTIIYTCRVDPCIHYIPSLTNSSVLQCMICVSPYLLSNGKCIINCPVGTYQSQLQCKACQRNCIQCADYSRCTKCLYPPYHFHNLQCLDNCPAGTYSYQKPINTISIFVDGQCLPCSQDCLVCTNGSYCQICAAGYFLSNNGKCALICYQGFYADADSSTCRNCSTNCQSCLNILQCQTCAPGSFLISGQCVTDCPQRYFPSGGKCLPCNQYCRSCGVNSNCSQCISGYLLNLLTNQCVQQCPTGTYVTNLRQCAACASSCLSCVYPNQCISCLAPKILYNAQCVNQCPSGYTLINNICTQCDSYCKQCSITRDNCTSCQIGFQLINGYCRATCPSHTFLNSSNQCQSCTTLNPKCSQCYGPAVDQCIQCYSPYYLLNNVCVFNCPEGYFSSITTSSQCLPCDNRCLTCNQNSLKCTTCPWGYYLVNGSCLNKCPNGYYPTSQSNNYSCKTCINPCIQCTNSNTCITCLPGYFVTPFGTCVTNCSLLTNSSLPTSSFYTSNTNLSRCEQCSTSCRNCISSSQCVSCISPYHLYNNECIIDCPPSTYLNTTSNTCQQCTKIYCTSCISSTQCIECQPGYYLLNSSCTQTCPSGYTIMNGECIINNNNNTLCTGYWLNTTNGSTECVPYCPLGYYPSNYLCLPCSVACAACKNTANCQQCISSYILLNGQCIFNCPTGYIQQGSICIPCSSNCSSCSPSSTDCTSCLTSYYLFNGQCVAVCPATTYTDPITKKCLFCPTKCITCSSATQCLQCQNTRYNPPNCTDTFCSSSMYKIQSTGQCGSCDISCLTCKGGSIYDCLSCQSPLRFINGQCRTYCPNGYVLNTLNNTCISCNTGCKNCTFNTLTLKTSCIQCFIPFILYNNACIQSCQVIETSIQSYTINDLQCYPCSQNCISCTLSNFTTNSTTCIVCQAGYILFMGSCINQCPTNYYPLQNSCYRCPQNCQSCSSAANSCIICTNNTYLIYGNCVPQCPNATYANTATTSCIPCTTLQCNRCTTAANKCDQCNPPFAVDQYNGCNNCIPGYLWDSVTRGCLPCDSSCSTCNYTVNNCTTCAGGRILVQGQCVQQCPVAFYQITLNNIIQCKLCPTNCTVCQPSSTNSSSLECYQCKTGYYHNVATHECLRKCPTNTYITNSTDCNICPTICSTCSSSTQCDKCITGYYLFNGQCVNVCPNQYVPVNGTCQNCGIGCINCTSLNNCTKCRSDYFLNINKTCSQILPCPTGQYSDVDGSCKPCETNCLACTNSTNCTQCVSNLFLNNGNCNNTCSANQYSTTIIIYTQTTNTTSKICKDCLLPCDSCISNTSCTHCIANYYLNANKTCVADCGSGFYNSSTIVTVNGNTITNRSCIPCTDTNCKKCTLIGCQQCETGFYLLGYNLANQTNSKCVNTCPSGYYNDSTALPPACRQCNISGCDICNSIQCSKCLPPLILLILNNTSSCVSQCPPNMMQVTTNNITKCQNCINANCLQCRTEQWCKKCIYPFYLQIVANLTQDSIINYKTSCQQNCSIGYYAVNNNITANNTCQRCQTNCMFCINLQNCSQCIQTYVLVDQDCIPQKCFHCTKCVNQKCQACEIGYYLYQVEGKCYQICPDGYFGNNQTSKCQICMDNCLKCPSLDMCDQCKDGYNFTGTICVDQAYIQYGALSNMSGFTSNITYITSAIYLGTSIGPMVFGQMTTTYFNIQFCQFILFHARASGNNSQMNHFLDSLQSISLTLPSNNQNGNNTNSRRRMLATSLSDPQQFLVTSAPIFAMMGAFLLVYLIIFLFEKYMQEESCLCCPKFKFYASQICVFMKKRFKWIYFDFIAWMSYVPFVYFSLMQLKAFSFETALSGFSCILSLVIIVAYPLYPFFIIYLLKQNYNDLVQQTNLLVQMSLSPFVYKVKRPEHQLVPDQPFKNYFTTQNFRLIYDPLKYLRKFIFVIIVALCPVPTTSLIMLIILNIIFIGYMAVFRPRVMPYMIFDFIIQGILLFFEVFMLVYLYSQTAKVTAMSIATHAVGFITSNLSLIIAIILNIIAYYKIFMCLYELYKHLQQKAIEKEKADLKDQQQQSHHTYQQNDLPEKDLTKSLKGIKKLRDSKGQDATQYDQSDNPSKLMRDKQLYGDNDRKKDLKRSTGGLPDLKKSTSGKDKNKKPKLDFEQFEDTLKPFEDKQLPKKLRRSMDDDQLTQSNPDSKIQSGIFKDKEIYRIQKQEDLRNSQGNQIPDLKTSYKKQIKGKFISPNINNAHKLNKISESDEDSMINSHLSGEQLLTIKQGKIKEGTGNKYKRNNVNDLNQVIVSEGIPLKGTQNKYKRKTKQLPQIESRGLQQQIYDLREGKYKQIQNNDTKKQKQIENGKLYNKNPKNSKQLSSSQNGNMEQGQYKQRRNNQKVNNILDIPILQKQGKNKQTKNMDIPQGSFYGKQKPNKIGSNQDFDQFLQESQKKVPGVDLKQIERRKKYQQQQIADAQLRDRKNKAISKPNDINLQNQKGQIVIQGGKIVIQGGNLVEYKKDKFRRDNKKIFEDNDNNFDLQYRQNKGKKLSKNQDIFKEDQGSQIQSGQIKPQIKVKALKQNNKNNSQVQDNIQIENQKKKDRKRVIESDQGELGDQYQRRKQQEAIKRNKKGVLGVNQDYLQQEYDQIKKRNKDNMFSPQKGITDIMMGSLNVDDFDGSDYQQRPQSKIQRPGSKGKGMLGIDEKQANDSEDDSSSVRRQRVSAIQKLRKKQGNLGIDQRSDYSGDSATQRPQRQQSSKIQRKRKKSGILKLSNRNQTSQPVQSIQLQRNN